MITFNLFKIVFFQTSLLKSRQGIPTGLEVSGQADGVMLNHFQKFSSQKKYLVLKIIKFWKFNIIGF